MSHHELSAVCDEIRLITLVIDQKLNPIASKHEVDLYVSKIKKCSALLRGVLEVAKMESLVDNEKPIHMDRVKHDLINPINGINGYLEIISEVNSSPIVISIVKEVKCAVRGMLTLIYKLETESSHYGN